MLRQVYIMVFYNLKKLLTSLHNRLNNMLLVLEQKPATVSTAAKTSVFLKPFNENQNFYIHFFGILVKADTIAKAKYKDLYQVVN